MLKKISLLFLLGLAIGSLAHADESSAKYKLDYKKDHQNMGSQIKQYLRIDGYSPSEDTGHVIDDWGWGIGYENLRRLCPETDYSYWLWGFDFQEVRGDSDFCDQCYGATVGMQFMLDCWREAETRRLAFMFNLGLYNHILKDNSFNEHKVGLGYNFAIRYFLNQAYLEAGYGRRPSVGFYASPAYRISYGFPIG